MELFAGGNPGRRCRKIQAHILDQLTVVIVCRSQNICPILGVKLVFIAIDGWLVAIVRVVGGGGGAEEATGHDLVAVSGKTLSCRMVFT